MSSCWPAVIAGGLVLLAVGLAAWWWRQALRAWGAGASAHCAEIRCPVWPLLLGIPLSLFNVVARTLMLPLLAMTLPTHPSLGVMAVGSFVLLYSQLVLPTPAGAGAVDLGFLAGMAGNLGEAPPTAGRVALLHRWRRRTARGRPGDRELRAAPAHQCRGAGGGAIATSMTVRSSASTTPWGTSAGAQPDPRRSPDGSRCPRSSSPFPKRGSTICRRPRGRAPAATVPARSN